MMSEKNTIFLAPSCAVVFLSLTEHSVISAIILTAVALTSAVLSYLFSKAIALLRGGAALQTVVICFATSAVLYPLFSTIFTVPTYAGGEAICGICAYFICINSVSSDKHCFTLTCAFFAISSLIVGVLRELLSEGSFFGSKIPFSEKLTIRIFTGAGGALLICAVVIGALRFFTKTTISGGEKNE